MGGSLEAPACEARLAGDADTFVADEAAVANLAPLPTGGEASDSDPAEGERGARASLLVAAHVSPAVLSDIASSGAFVVEETRAMVVFSPRRPDSSDLPQDIEDDQFQALSGMMAALPGTMAMLWSTWERYERSRTEGA